MFAYSIIQQVRKRTATIFKIDEPMESSSASTPTAAKTQSGYQPGLEADLFQADERSRLELFGRQPEDGERGEEGGWADFGAFGSEAKVKADMYI